MNLAKQKLLAVTCALTTALVWGLMWFPFRTLHEAGFSTAATSLTVYLVSAALGVVLFREVFRREARFEFILLPLALLYGWCNFSYTWAVSEGQVMRVLLLFYLSPLWSALFSWLLLHERLSRIGWLVIAMSLGGMLVILYRPGLFSGDFFSSRADWLALSGGISFALGNVLSKRAHALPVALKSAMVWLGVAACGLASLLWRGQLGAELMLLHGEVLLIVLVLGVTLLATSIISMHGLSILPATQVMTLMLMELLFAAISAYLLAGERMQLQEWIGGALIASASLLSGHIVQKKPATTAELVVITEH